MTKVGPITCVAGVVVRGDGALLSVKRGKDPEVGKWTLPGGHIECGETGEQAVKRELYEETKMVCRVTKFLGIYEYITANHHLIILIFDCECEEGQASPGDDADAVGWFLPEELALLPKTDGLFQRVEALRRMCMV